MLMLLLMMSHAADAQCSSGGRKPTLTIGIVGIAHIIQIEPAGWVIDRTAATPTSRMMVSCKRPLVVGELVKLRQDAMM